MLQYCRTNSSRPLLFGATIIKVEMNRCYNIVARIQLDLYRSFVQSAQINHALIVTCSAEARSSVARSFSSGLSADRDIEEDRKA